MSVIIGIIPPQAYELIRNRIVEILGEEMENQFILSSDADLNVSVWMERNISFDKEELTPAAMTVSFIDGNYENEDPRDADGVYSYAVDIYARSVDTDSTTGDTTAALIVQKILGKVRAILNATQYKTLGFLPVNGKQIIKNRRCSQIQVWDPKRQQGIGVDTSTAYDQAGRIVFIVKAFETVEVIVPVIEKGSTTKVSVGGINQTAQGFVWSRNNPEL